MAYLTRDYTGLIQLWNNKPELTTAGIWIAWVNKTDGNNEVAIDITANDTFREFIDKHRAPCCVHIRL